MRSAALDKAGTRASRTGRDIAVDVVCAVGAATAALVVRLLMDEYLGTRLPFLPFLGAVVAAARYRGQRAGFLVAGLGLAAVFWLRGDAFGSIEAFGSVGFALVSVLVIEWIDQLHLLHRQVERQNAALQKDSMERDAAKRDERAHRDRLRLTLLSIGDGVLVTDANGHIELLNPVAEQLTGWPTHDARNRPLNEVFALVDRNSGEPVEAPIASAMDQHRKTSLPRSTSLKHRDGRLIPIEDSIAPMIEDSGAVSGSIVVFRDISARLESESALRDSEARFRMIADNMAPLAWTADAAGRPTWFNRRWYEFTGITPGMLDRHEWLRRIHPEHVDRVVTSGDEALRRGIAWESTFPLRGADGQYRWFLSRLVPIENESGNTVRWFGTNTDVTDRVHMEESLRDADRRKDEFVATLAHELRNPLAPLQHAVHLLDTAESVAAPRELVHVMQRQVTQMSRMVDDLIDLSLGDAKCCSCGDNWSTWRCWCGTPWRWCDRWRYSTGITWRSSCPRSLPFCSLMRRASPKRSPTCCATPASSRLTEGVSVSRSRGVPIASACPSPIPASASHPIASAACSTCSHRDTTAGRGPMVALASG